MGLLKIGAAARWHPHDKAVSRCPYPQNTSTRIPYLHFLSYALYA